MRALTRLSVAAAASMAFAAPAAVYAAPLQERVVVASPDPRTRGAQPHGALSPSQPMHLVITLRLRHEDELERLIQNLYTPGSPDAGRFLTPAEFDAAFAPTEADVQAVVQGLRAYGLSAAQTADRMVLTVAGSARDVERAFGVREVTYEKGAATWYAPDGAATLPAPLAAQVSAVVGLSSATVERHLVMAHAAPAGGGYTPAQIQCAYDYTPLYSHYMGRGQVIAVVTSGSVQLSDIQAFDRAFGLPNPVVRQRVIDGSYTSPDDETTLDCEWAHAIAPTASLAVYEAAQPDAQSFIDAFAQVAADDGAHVVTTSWGAPESETDSSTMQAEHQIFMQMAAQGQSMFAAAGDSGSSDGTSGTDVDYPSSDPYVTACGGTRLVLGAGGQRLQETAWSDTGGGVSSVYGEPWWQYGPGVPQTGYRQTCDVSLNADPATGYDFYYQGQWEMAGGTSFVAPMMAATFALIDQARALEGKAPVGLADVGIYAMARNTSYAPYAFHDITAGSNGAYSAGPGWDHPTGFGSIDAYYFLHGLD
ncbi:S8/S53 family peptidase [Alicyclobacillus mali]|uniref:S8/S53 family peptidase n=1 Tax=Alicyclobacillus mali (ex Roth et al. 2021) TaxID=1123961 RepID=A0ABS0EZQ4_9BACL|nr:S53 family peptidase [Alicyclobacillus mali (ex Roth et al. 2021)]MBF8376523.1 S8/S53 family peptidase [Alicyclobacillus mali (ex Roth et al. 2021)]